jgi:tight adherence protein B
MPTILIYAFVFAAVLLSVDTLFRVLAGYQRSRKDVNERLALLKRGGDQVAAYQQILRERAAEGGFQESGLFSWAARMYRQSGLRMTVPRRLAYCIGAVIISAFVANYLTGDVFFQVIITFGLALAGIVLFVLRKRAKRISKFVQQLPVAIEIIVRSLNAGHPLTSAISLVGREMADPIGSEFGILSDQLTFGSELDMAMLNMVDRVGADELNLVAVTVSVQRGTGGNLAEILENLAKMIRDRGLLRAKIRAISAEGRITAMIMSVFPLGLYLMISTLVPSYFDPVWESGYGTTVVLTIIGVMSVGIFIMFRMVRFDF